MNYPGKFIDIKKVNVSGLAFMCDVSRQTIYNVWCGNSRPSIDLAIKIYNYLKSAALISVDFFEFWD